VKTVVCWVAQRHRASLRERGHQMLLWVRQRLVSVGLGTLLSLTLAPGAALPCPGEGGGGGGETLSVTPGSAVFESRSVRRNFVFSWAGAGGGTGATELSPTEHFRISSDGCRGFSFSNGAACIVQTEMIREGGRARLTVRAGGRQATAELTGAVAGPPTFTVTPETSQTFERVGATRRFAFVYNEGPIRMRLRKFVLPESFAFQENTCTPFSETINPCYTCEFVVRLIRAGVSSWLEVEVWNTAYLRIRNIPIIG
jgi:hypothetical protein